MNTLPDAPSQYHIESAQPCHLNKIMEIENECFGPDSFSRRQMAYLLAKAKGAFYVIRESTSGTPSSPANQPLPALPLNTLTPHPRTGHIRGYISLVYRSNASNLRIYSVAVHPAARGKGFAQALIDKSCKYARTKGLRSITLEVDTENAPAIALYAKNGFYTTHFLLGYYHHGNGFRMKKEL